MDRFFGTRRWLGAIGACVALAGGCNDEALGVTGDAGPGPGSLTPEQASAVVARVGDRVITLGEFAATLERMNRFDRLRYQTSEQRRQLLEQMVDAELLAQEALRRGLDKQEGVQQQMQLVLKEAMLAKAREGVGRLEDITEQAIADYYAEHRAEFVEPERRRVSAIVMKNRKQAEAVLKDAVADQSGARWGALFAKHSVTAPAVADPSAPADLAGSLGIVGPPDDPRGGSDQVPVAVQAAVFRLKDVGQVADELVVADGKLYIVRLSGRTAGHTRTVTEASRSIRILLFQERIKQKEAEAVAELRKRFEVRVDEDALAAVKVPEAVERMTMPWERERDAGAEPPSAPTAESEAAQSPAASSEANGGAVAPPR
jgi:hypothetical protein